MEIELHLIKESQFKAITEAESVEDFARSASSDSSFESTEIHRDPYASPLLNVEEFCRKSPDFKGVEGLRVLSRIITIPWDDCGIIRNILSPEESALALVAIQNPPDFSIIS